jgi:predicted  nucleic acid-binding Zn-ribbon protein
MNIALSLFRLQSIDTIIFRYKARIAQIDRILNDKTIITEIEHEISEIKSLLEERNISLKQVTNQVESTQLKLKLNQNALFGGKISNSKELRDLEQEADALNRFIAKLEEDELECMMAVEEAQISLQNAENKLNDTKGRKTETDANLLGEKLKMEKELPSLLHQKKTIFDGIVPEIQIVYSNLLNTKNGLAVVEVIDDSCSACGYELAPADQQSARSPASLLRCKVCSRILFKS